MTKPLRIASSALSLLAAGALLAVLPYLVGVDWPRIGTELSRLSPPAVLGLTVLWLAGLWAYTYVFTASLPGLTHPHAFMLNAVGSSVSNLLPFGGAAGVAVTFAMARGWGHRNSTIMVSTLVTGLWNVMARLLLPAVGIGALLVTARLPDRRLALAAGLACVLLLAIVSVLALALRSESMAWAVDRWLKWASRRGPAGFRRLMTRADGALLTVRRDTLQVLRAGWLRLTLGMVVYLVLQALLLVGCLNAVGARVPVAEIVVVFALNRMLTIAVITPSGAGISETGTAALLLSFGVDPAAATAAVVLYAFYTYVIEIPLGGLAWVGWALRRRVPVEPVPDAGQEMITARRGMP